MIWTWLVTCILICLVLVLFALVWGYLETKRYKLTHYDIKNANTGSKEKKLLFLSDLHDHVYKPNNEGLIQSIRDQEPTAILIGGDLLIGVPDYRSDHALDFVRAIAKIAPVYYAFGNHEQRMDTWPERYGEYWTEYYQKLSAAGVHFLNNDSLVLNPEEEHRIRVYGLTIPAMAYHKFRPQLLTLSQIEDRISVSVNDEYSILLAHNPKYMDVYKEWGADLILSGHFHGGVARIPGWRGVISTQFHLFPKYSGEMTVEGNQTIVVSRGMGTHTIKLRYFNAPEVIVLYIS